jgi:4a-hydroxytetrahydrobiopterin dehydratase
MPELLTDEAITTALLALPGWGRAGNRLVREVKVPTDSQDSLERSIAEVADALDHHPDLRREGDTVHLELWTHSAGGITSKDVELAARIDRVLSGSSGTGD